MLVVYICAALYTRSSAGTTVRWRSDIGLLCDQHERSKTLRTVMFITPLTTLTLRPVLIAVI